MSNLESILNVDDYDPGRYARTKVLRMAGFSVLEATTGEETLLVAAEHRPSLILLDVNLPGMNGFETCRRLRENPETSAATIVHISASSVQSHHQVNGLEAGADGYLVEPIDPSVLVATINAFLRARRAEEALRRSNAELEWFAHRAAHDLNEPLRAIAVHAQLLERELEGRLGPDAKASLEFVTDAAQRMGSLIKGLLGFAQVGHGGSGAIELNAEVLLGQVCENLQAAIGDAGAQITHDQLPVIVADPGLEEVFQNLIANAIKYRREVVTPEIHVSARSEGSNWRFSVRDNGIGIQPADRESIFKIFTRLHGHDIPGSGIGLALCRKIIEAHGGTIWVESEPGTGSTFYFTVPCRALTARSP